jgi:hypothetical protein
VGAIDHPETTVLYKYMSNQERVLDVLSGNRIWYPKPEGFNDPFDCDLDIASSVTWEQYEGAIRAEGRQKQKGPDGIESKLNQERSRYRGSVPAEYRDKVRCGVAAVRDILRDQGVLSLSADCSSIPMWSYYAASHAGVCIGLRRDPTNPLGSTAARRVSYSSVYPSISYYDLFQAPGRLSDIVMTTKAIAWAHEQEWRVSITQGDRLHELPGELACVLFGLRTPDSFKQQVAKVTCGRQSIELRQALKTTRKFEIEFRNYR